MDKKPTLDRPKMMWVLFLIGMAALTGVLLWTRMSSSTKAVSMARPNQCEQSTNLGTNTEGNTVLSSILQTCLYHMVRSKLDVDKDTLVTLMKATFHQESFSGRFLETTPGLASMTLTYVHKMTQSRLKAENQKTLGSISLSCLEYWRESAPDEETARVLAAVSEMCITDIMNQRDDDGVVLALSEVSQTCLYQWTKPETSLDSVSALTSITQTCLYHWIRLAGGVDSRTRLPSITQICMTLLEKSLPSADDAVAMYAMSEACLGHIIRAEPHTGHQVLASVSNICIGYLGQPGKTYTWKKALVSILQTCIQYSGDLTSGKNQRIKLGNTVSTCMSYLTKYPSDDRFKKLASISALGVNFLHRSPQDAEVEAVLYSIIQECLDYWTNYGSLSLPSAPPSLPTTHEVPLHPTPPTTVGGHVEPMETPSEASRVLLFSGLLILVLKLNLDDSVTEKAATIQYPAGVIGAFVWGEVILKGVTSKSLFDALGVAVVKCAIPILCPVMILILVYNVFIWITIKKERRNIVAKDNRSLYGAVKALFKIFWLCFLFAIFKPIFNQFIVFLLVSYVFIICAWGLWYLPKLITIFAVLLGGVISVGAVNVSIRYSVPLKLTCNVLIAIIGAIAILS